MTAQKRLDLLHSPFKDVSDNDQDQGTRDAEQEVLRFWVANVSRILHVFPGSSRWQPVLVVPELL